MNRYPQQQTYQPIRTRPIAHQSLNRMTRAVLSQQKAELADYIRGILEPEYAFTSMKVVKQPSTIPIPSTTVTFRNNINIPTDSNGDFTLAWNPNYLTMSAVLNQLKFISSEDQPHTYTVDAYSHVFMRKPTATQFGVFLPSYIPNVDMSKYRLVSAKLKVTYIGSNLQKSGMMYACATYDKTPIAVAYNEANYNMIPITNPSSSTQAELSPAAYPDSWKKTLAAMNERTISNGLWAKNCNVTEPNQGISCLHIPTDPSSEIFQPLGTYFGHPQPTGNKVWATTSDLFKETVLPEDITGDQGSQLCFLVCGHGMPASTECVNLQIYYNFEIIPTPQTAPFMRPTLNTFPPAILSQVRTTLNNSAQQIAIRPKSTPISNSLINSMASLAKSVNNAMPYVSTALNLTRLFG